MIDTIPSSNRASSRARPGPGCAGRVAAWLLAALGLAAPGCDCQPSIPSPGGAPEPTPTPLIVTPPHPFVETIDGVITTAEEPPSVPIERPRPLPLKPTELRTRDLALAGHPTVQLKATPQVPAVALDHLAAHLEVLDLPVTFRKDLLQIVDESPSLVRGEVEVALPMLRDAKGRPLMLAWPDSWELSRPGVLRPRREALPHLELVAEGGGGGEAEQERLEEVGSATAALIGSWSTIRGRLECGTGNPLPFVQVFVAGQVTSSDASGHFEVTGSFSELDRIDVAYDTTITNNGASSALTVWRDDQVTRRDAVDVPEGITSFGVLDLGALRLDTTACELFETGAEVLAAYHDRVGASPPAGGLRMKLYEHVEHDAGTPYAYYDHVVVPANFRSRNPFTRRGTIFHEFGHTVRHAADGDRSHWDYDNVRFLYGRRHTGNEIFNEHYAFNEGWAQYWKCTRPGAGSCPAPGPDVPGSWLPLAPGTADPFVDWNEMQVGRRLKTLSEEPGMGPAAMVRVLTENPGAIHTLWEYELRYCAVAPQPNRECDPATGLPRRAKQPCPPGFDDDGATCRQANVLAKDSYPRHGDIPSACAEGAENHGGLCHGPCPPGYDPWGFHCWQQCPADMHDDGGHCRRDVQIINAENSCPWTDVCGLFNDCTRCPPGFHNDGCTCRRDAWIFEKHTIERSLSWPGCEGDKVYNGGLCYDRCRPGFVAAGSVCWGACPPGFDDHGATCYRPPNILIK